MLDRIDLPQGTLDLLILRTLAQRHSGKSVGRTYSSILQDNGEDVKVVQKLLRHSSSKMTLDVYAQALTPTKRAAQRKVVAMIREDLSVPRSVPRKIWAPV
jgi:integrase